jgi:hypothetical protein
VKNHFPEIIQACVKRLTPIRLGKGVYKCLKVGITGDHKGGNWNMQFSGLGCHGIAFVRYKRIEAIAVFVIGSVRHSQTTGLSISNHKDLLVGVSFSSQ